MNLSTTAWNTSQQLANLSNTYYNVSVLNVSQCAWNASLQLANLSLSFFNVSTVNLSTTAWNTSQQLANVSQSYFNVSTVNLSTTLWNASQRVDSLNTSLQNVSSTLYAVINGSNASFKNACFTNASCITFNSTSISTANACVTNLSCTSIALGTNPVATQTWVQGQNYLTSQPVSMSITNASIRTPCWIYFCIYNKRWC